MKDKDIVELYETWPERAASKTSSKYGNDRHSIADGTISDNARIKAMLCIVLAAAMAFLVSGCGANNSGGTIGAADQSHISTTTPDEDPLDKNVPAIDEPAENNQPDAIDELSPNTAPQPQENTPENTAAGDPSTEPADDELVQVLDHIPSIYIELKYAAEDNFTGAVVYDFTDAYLRYGTVKKLAEVQTELLAQGYSLKIWDAYRPVDAQFKLWEICPDPVYVADPNTGYSSHSRGNTIDVTLVLADGTEIGMPTGFDDFSALADRDYSDVPADAAENVLILENMMKDHGFKCYSKEWWHYSDSRTYPVVQS